MQTSQESNDEASRPRSVSVFGGHSMVAPLQTVIVRRPAMEFSEVDPAGWGYTGIPHLETAQTEHDAFVAILQLAGVSVVYHDSEQPHLADSIFVHDPIFTTDNGTIQLRMGKPLRVGEEASLAETAVAAGVPLHGALTAPATAEGGDLMWLSPNVLAVGLGFRTNQIAIDQLSNLLPRVTIVGVGLPWHTGPDHCLHLMSLISMVDDDLAVAYKPLLPVPFLGLLAELGIQVVDAAPSELATHATNVLALGPRQCVMLRNNPVTMGRLIAAGCEVAVYKGDEITLKADGGATCLTRPILRG